MEHHGERCSAPLVKVNLLNFTLTLGHLAYIFHVSVNQYIQVEITEEKDIELNSNTYSKYIHTFYKMLCCHQSGPALS